MKATVLASFLAMTSTVFAANYSFKGTTDRNPLEYAKGEPMSFTVTLVDRDDSNKAVVDLAGKGIELRWSFSSDRGVLDEETQPYGTSSANPLTLTALPKASGFVRLNVSVYVNGTRLTEKTEQFNGGAGVDVMDLQEFPAPPDFVSFWSKAVRELRSTPFDGAYAGVCTNFVPPCAAGDVEYFLFELPMPNDRRPSTGIIAMPAGANPASCGLVVTFDGYGFGPTSRPSAAAAREGNIVMTVSRQGESPMAGQAYYDALEADEMKGFCFRNNDGAVQKTDFYRMIMRDLRALQFAKSLKTWNRKNLKVAGSAMGGYRALVASALCDGVTACAVSMPWCQDLSGMAKFGRKGGGCPAYTPTLGYLEGKNFARLITCPVAFTARLGDYMCPPAGEVLLYRNLSGPKRVVFCQNAGHDGDYGIDTRRYVLQSLSPVPGVVVPDLNVVSSSFLYVRLDTRSRSSFGSVLARNVGRQPQTPAGRTVASHFQVMREP